MGHGYNSLIHIDSKLTIMKHCTNRYKIDGFNDYLSDFKAYSGLGSSSLLLKLIMLYITDEGTYLLHSSVYTL